MLQEINKLNLEVPDLFFLNGVLSFWLCHLSDRAIQEKLSLIDFFNQSIFGQVCTIDPAKVECFCQQVKSIDDAISLSKISISTTRNYANRT